MQYQWAYATFPPHVQVLRRGGNAHGPTANVWTLLITRSVDDGYAVRVRMVGFRTSMRGESSLPCPSQVHVGVQGIHLILTGFDDVDMECHQFSISWETRDSSRRQGYIRTYDTRSALIDPSYSKEHLEETLTRIPRVSVLALIVHCVSLGCYCGHGRRGIRRRSSKRR